MSAKKNEDAEIEDTREGGGGGAKKKEGENLWENSG
jgi:hypothetical protein